MAKRKEKDAAIETPEQQAVAKLSILQKITNDINKKYLGGKEDVTPIISVGKDIKEQLSPKFIKTGIGILDEKLGGGIPKGAVSTISGTPGSGKTCLGLMLVAEVQKQGGTAVWIDAEPPFPYLMAILLGVDIDSLIIVRAADYGEQILDILHELLYDPDNRLTRGIVDLVIVDSLNGMVPKAQYDKGEKDGLAGSTIGRRAAMLSKWLEELAGRGMLREGTALVNIAQLRTNINAYGAPDQISGGNAVRFFSKLITVLAKKKLEKAPTKGKDGEDDIGHTVAFDVRKNNIVGRLGRGQYNVLYGLGVDDSMEIFTNALSAGIISKSGKANYLFKIPNEDGEIREFLVEGGIDVARALVREDRALKAELTEALKIQAVPEKETDFVDLDEVLVVPEGIEEE